MIDTYLQEHTHTHTNVKVERNAEHYQHKRHIFVRILLKTSNNHAMPKQTHANVCLDKKRLSRV